MLASAWQWLGTARLGVACVALPRPRECGLETTNLRWGFWASNYADFGSVSQMAANEVGSSFRGRGNDVLMADRGAQKGLECLGKAWGR
ncbi:hypothetical protein K440DRAFT_612095 [Wilcoxina mikolae CBS 423.85]|nr:hypothetical protein K440DRAFT_612095 [Wilcoxina mikolae CBS 423.85]